MVTWLDLDRVEQRYLLSAAADCSIAIYDTQVSPKEELNARQLDVNGVTATIFSARFRCCSR